MLLRVPTQQVRVAATLPSLLLVLVRRRIWPVCVPRYCSTGPWYRILYRISPRQSHDVFICVSNILSSGQRTVSAQTTRGRGEYVNYYQLEIFYTKSEIENGFCSFWIWLIFRVFGDFDVGSGDQKLCDHRKIITDKFNILVVWF